MSAHTCWHRKAVRKWWRKRDALKKQKLLYMRWGVLKGEEERESDEGGCG